MPNNNLIVLAKHNGEVYVFLYDDLGRSMLTDAMHELVMSDCDFTIPDASAVLEAAVERDLAVTELE